MIAYDELVSALTLWREGQGLPIGSADYLGTPPPPPPVSFGGDEDIELAADDAVISEMDEPAAEEVNFGESIDPYGAQLGAQLDYADHPAEVEPGMELSAEPAVEIADLARAGDSDEELSATADFATEPEPVAEVGHDDATAPRDFYEDPADGADRPEEVAFISSSVPLDEAPEPPPPELDDYPAIDATKGGIVAAPPAEGEVNADINTDDYPAMDGQDPTVEGFVPLGDDEI